MTQVDVGRLARILLERWGTDHEARIRRGLAQVVARWRPEDGSAEALERFVVEHYIADPAMLDDTFSHLQYAMEMLDGHANEVARELARYQVLEVGPLRPVDGMLAAYSPKAHIQEDLFRSRIAFVALLNFPLTTLEQRLSEGPAWTRRQWAEARLTGRFEHRVPPQIIQQIDRTSALVESYIDGYNIHMERVVLPGGSSFPAGLKLISHWGLRDEIRGQYGKGPEGLARQRIITRIMERIIRQEIPGQVINAADLQWDVEQNLVRPAGKSGGKWQEAPREKDTRYAHLLSVFQALRQADPYFPELPTHMDRIFSIEREIPEARIRRLLQSVLQAPVAREVGAMIRRRLGRPLEPFDLWYVGFSPKSKMDERALDDEVRERYPTVETFQQDLPRILRQLGFSEQTAAFLAGHIVVDSARGAGHAYGAKRREDRAHLRTRFGKGGMDYKGFNIAIHELGHNVEQVFSISRIDHTLLEGVPNTGFTEAFAFLFQARDLELLGHQLKDPQAEALLTLDRFWNTFEIAGVALLDMDLWHWMYEHPEATPSELRQATVKLATDLWNRYYAPVFEVRDAILPAIYSHIIAYGLYTPDYPLGFLITFQVEQHLKGRDLAAEMERICRLGRLAPDVWMQQAVGRPISSAPLIEATQRALARIGGKEAG